MSDFIVKEYAVKDKDGKIKIWQSGKLINYQKWLAEQASKFHSTGGFTEQSAMLDTGMEEPRLAPPAPALRIEIRKYSLEKIVERLKEQFSLQLTEESLNRFNKLLLSYFRGARQIVDVRRNLQQDWFQKQSSLRISQIDQLVAVIKEIEIKIKSNHGEVVSMEIEGEKMKALPQVQQQIRQAQIEAKESVQNSMNKGDIGEMGVKKEEIEEPRKFFSFKKRSQALSSGKIPIEEVKRFNKLVGPVEELRQLSLKVFRRLGTTASQTTEKILRRVDSLSDGSLQKKLGIIQAWQGSPVYNLYVKLGRMSLEEGLSVETIINRETNTGQETLTAEEFAAISDLNKKLRF